MLDALSDWMTIGSDGQPRTMAEMTMFAVLRVKQKRTAQLPEAADWTKTRGEAVL